MSEAPTDDPLVHLVTGKDSARYIADIEDLPARDMIWRMDSFRYCRGDCVAADALKLASCRIGSDDGS
jgi:hypothetical protein